MKKTLYFLVIYCLLTARLCAQTSEAYFTSYPTLSPNGNTVIFSYEGDLWKLPLDQQPKAATRITAMQGLETRAKISPDGQWLAFSASQYGNTDVFLMPMKGGEVVQLTFYDSFDHVESWSWDSQWIYFSSNRYNQYSTYKVAAKGGTPQRVFDHYFHTVHNLFEHPISGELFFNEGWESKAFIQRKRYKGAFNPDIQSYNPQTNTYKKYTQYKGKDLWATLDQKGNIYFASDENTGEYNLYTFRNGQKTALTKFDDAIKRPFVSANGQRVIFEKDYQLYIYEVASGQNQKLDIQIYKNNTLKKDITFRTQGFIKAYDIAPDHKKIAFVARGELFVSDIKGKYIRQITTKPDDRVVEVHWLKNSQRLLFSQTVGGYLNWFIIDANGQGQEKQLTADKQNNRLLSFNSDRSKAVYLSGRNEVRIINLRSFKNEIVAKDELWGFQNDLPVFSPDGQYIAYTAYRNFERDIFLYHIKKKELVQLTKTGISEVSPRWSPDGKYIYFVSNRSRPFYPYGITNGTHVYRLALDKFDTEFKSEKFDELFDKKKKKGKETDKKKKRRKKKQSKKTKVSINFTDLWSRLELVSPRSGTQASVYVTQKGKATQVLFTSNHERGTTFQVWKKVYKPFEKPKTSKIKGSRTFSLNNIREVKGRIYLLTFGRVYKMSGNHMSSITLAHSFQKNFALEFKQMFYELWANLEENFYNQTFHGINWQQMKKKYEKFLPHVHNRNDLRVLLNDMLGELNASHLGFKSFGIEETVFYESRTLTTGLLFDKTNPYKISKIVKRSPADVTGKNIRPGDVLVAVNGQKINLGHNREKYFSKPSYDREITLTLQRKRKKIKVRLHVQSSKSLRRQLYQEWEDQRKHIVDSISNHQIAYVHMRDMGNGELQRFLNYMTAEAYNRKGLILDLRYNTGGNVHDHVLKFLSQRPYLKWKYREGAFAVQPNFAPAAKPMILLINQQSLSDAEMTAAGFKQLKLGKIIGTETYRWIIFTSGKSLVDGSFYRLPSWGCYTLAGKNLEREGVAPDISVKNTFKDRVEHKDPQLMRAIEEIKKQLK
ncbi:S41 family peptidase [uncultured Microscilla sp.]|uniref:S41 family peptidase n=1 Tax=uncultured Microscilla sp. TaxID=432653 RepID=UPI00261D17D1|nr:S41 family peptidase [uncultured Microscilla sp.]